MEMVDMFRAAMAGDAELGRNAEQLSRALYFGSAPLANRSDGTAQMETEVGAFARAYIAGARVLARGA
jgi:hypothetical protein